ncbi:hypothetical protein [Novosphingobium resinovorum]|uniref:hypothetical protein n=1 Tax=Novosphingobium resinovorum TaxID=158500 RepID=UPI002ED17EC3|nr:hypothetical protein [Novosphingobium resinovorum]
MAEMKLIFPIHSARYAGSADCLSLAPEPGKQMDISMHVSLEVFDDTKKRVPDLFGIDAECLRNDRNRLFLAEKQVDGLGYIGRLFAQYRFKLAGMARKPPLALPTGMRTTRTKKKFAKRGQDFLCGHGGLHAEDEENYRSSVFLLPLHFARRRKYYIRPQT